jgi:hypothetical protein
LISGSFQTSRSNSHQLKGCYVYQSFVKEE